MNIFESESLFTEKCIKIVKKLEHLNISQSYGNTLNYSPSKNTNAGAQSSIYFRIKKQISEQSPSTRVSVYRLY